MSSEGGGRGGAGRVDAGRSAACSGLLSTHPMRARLLDEAHLRKRAENVSRGSSRVWRPFGACHLFFPSSRREGVTNSRRSERTITQANSEKKKKKNVTRNCECTKDKQKTKTAAARTPKAPTLPGSAVLASCVQLRDNAAYGSPQRGDGVAIPPPLPCLISKACYVRARSLSVVILADHEVVVILFQDVYRLPDHGQVTRGRTAVTSCGIQRTSIIAQSCLHRCALRVQATTKRKTNRQAGRR